MNPAILAIFGLPGGTEWLVIGVIALLLFGRRLPEVARSFGKSIVEFKRGLRDVKDEIEEPQKLDGPADRRLGAKTPTVAESTPASVAQPEPAKKVAPSADTAERSSPSSQ